MVIVQNSPPSISSVEFESPVLATGQGLTVVPVAEDRDGDLIHYHYKWIINGTLIEEVLDSTLPRQLMKKGDEVILAVTPYDDFGAGATFQGLSFYIPNAAPIIVSQPPPLVSNHYVYHVEASDPDGDDLDYRLVQGPVGMAIDEKTGIVSWTVDQNTSLGDFDIEIIVEDPEGLQSRQFYTLSLSKSGSEN